MARSSYERRSRGEITETVEERDQEYKEKTEDLREETEDIGIERETIEHMEGSEGTSEGVEAVTSSLREAETTSVGEFTDDGAALEAEQSEGKEFEGELGERADSTTDDAERISQAEGELTSDASRSLMERAESEMREDGEFLTGQEEEARESRETSEAEHDQLKQIVFGEGG